MPIIEFQGDQAKKIVDMINSVVENEKLRPHLGYSDSGNECERRTWYAFRWAYEKVIPRRLRKIYDTGHEAEEFMARDLTRVGFQITKQQAEIKGPFGHVLGHIDGIVYHPELFSHPHLLEFKTANEQNFKRICKLGVKRGKRKHYYQMQAYMGKLNLNNALYVLYNKNDSSYYIEVVKFNRTVFEEVERKVVDIVTSEMPPDRIEGASPIFFECKFCDAKEACFKNIIARNCRTCLYGTIEDGGKWTCQKQNYKELTTDAQRLGCEQYRLEPNFLEV